VIALAWLVVMAGVFYLLIWRPQQRRVASMRALQGALELGDEVITTSGIYGTITALRDDHLELEIASGVVVKVARGAVGTRVTADIAQEDVDRPDGSEGTGSEGTP
jgi:preprotein translocase subunit YajC